MIETEPNVALAEGINRHYVGNYRVRADSGAVGEQK